MYPCTYSLIAGDIYSSVICLLTCVEVLKLFSLRTLILICNTSLVCLFCIIFITFLSLVLLRTLDDLLSHSSRCLSFEIGYLPFSSIIPYLRIS